MDAVHRSVEEIFRDFKARRTGIAKALTIDYLELRRQCDPEKENLCLYGHPNEQWKVSLPPEDVPPEIPEPALGINFPRDGMPEEDWLALVAVHSDSWLLAVSFYFGARFGFNKADRKRLFGMINDLPTLFEMVRGAADKQHKEKSSDHNSSSSSKSQGGESGSKEEDEHGKTLCGACGVYYVADEFWICCDICERWFHGACVKITPSKAELIEQYECPLCTNKRARLYL